MKSKAKQALSQLHSFFVDHKSILIAYSGGIDSALLAWVAHKALGQNMVAVIADSPSLARHEKEGAEQFAKQHNIPFSVVETDEMKKESYLQNKGDRCYYCKQSLFERMETLQNELSKSSSLTWNIAYGVNQDDLGDYRPGIQAGKDHQILTPYLNFKIDKATIREICRNESLNISEKVAMPCLASRIPHGEEVNLKKLKQIEEGENLLRSLGFKEYRVRHHGDLARIEVGENEIDFLIKSRKEITGFLKKIGFLYTTVDLTPFKSGSLNLALNIKK